MRFYIKQKVFSFKDKFRIMDESQKELYTVEGKFISIQNKLQLLNMNGSQVLNAKKKLFRIFHMIEINFKNDYSHNSQEIGNKKM